MLLDPQDAIAALIKLKCNRFSSFENAETDL